MAVTIINGDCIEEMRKLPAESVHCCVTSPPYYGLRDYGVAGQLGLEKTPAEFIAQMVLVFEEVKRVLRKDGTCWINMGDSYANDGKWGGKSGGKHVNQLHGDTGIGRGKKQTGLKPKDMMGMPWRLAFALQDAGWYLRQDIIWHKPNPMPESIYDRCTKAHEYIFLLSKSAKYRFDSDAIREPVSGTAQARGNGLNPKSLGTGVGWGYVDHEKPRTTYKMPDGWDTGAGAHGSFHRKGREKGKTPGKNSRIRFDRDPAHQTEAKIRSKQNRSFSAAVNGLVDFRNKRSVWTVPTFSFKGSHFATFPPNLIRPCILAGCPLGGVVLDPFGGSGTTGQVAEEESRNSILIELNPEYIGLIKQRTAQSGLIFTP